MQTCVLCVQCTWASTNVKILLHELVMLRIDMELKYFSNSERQHVTRYGHVITNYMEVAYVFYLYLESKWYEM